ncbi:hypothetical protein ANO11243_072200 [Dothideomycetidae sp. 11243]|nr:hypothetical protein ANO11243_072200 [fungal sp. No.11243]
MTYKDLLDVVGVHEVGKGVYESTHNPENMGNAAYIAYGGCALATACTAAHIGVPDSHRIYSMTGNFLGPAQCDRKLIARVQEIRSTRTFTTKLVTISQKQNDGSERSCLVSLVDFHAVEKAELLNYSRPPSKTYAARETQPSLDEHRDGLVRDGKITADVSKMHSTIFGLSRKLWENRVCKGSMGAELLQGFAKDLTTEQDDLAMHEKSSADWFRSRVKLTARQEHAAAMAFQMDGAISFAPLMHSHRSLTDSAACSTLDFALRIFSNDLDMNQWHHREWKCIAAAVGRTYSEAQLWDEQGKLVAVMSQSCILRPPQPKL